MAKDLMDYNRLVDGALRSVVGQALKRAARDGLPGSHHFYISFRTGEPGVEIPEYLRTKYPEEMTIVVQHQFWGLEIDDEGFEVTLSFRKSPERLRVPFAALTGFFDPSVQFGLQFKGGEGEAGGAQVARSLLEPAKTPALAAPKPAQTAEKGGVGKVVTLDQFRKK
jgi:hypothetical protein